MIESEVFSLISQSLAVPLIAAFCAAVIPYRNIRDGLVVLISAVLPVLVYQIYQNIMLGDVPMEWNLGEVVPGLAIYFKIEALGVIFAIILAMLWIVSLIYSIGYMRGNNEGRQGSFFAFFCIAIFSSLGVAFSGNLLTLFVFYEVLTFSTYPLVTHHRTKESMRAGRKYLGILVGTSMLFFLPAIILTFNAAGTLDFTNGGILADKISPNMTMILLALFIFGIAKAAVMPVHKWLPTAMVAPTPVSALLHAVAIVKAGVFTVIKVVVYIFGVDNLANVTLEFAQYGEWLLYVSCFTVIVASVVALAKDNLKQVLAYSTISQLSYIVMALAIFTPKAIIAASFQIVAHAFAKIVLFFSAGAIYTTSHKKKISELAGVGRHMPFTMVAFSIAALSIIGLPPTAGFIAKWYILDAAIGMEHYLVVAVIAVSTMLSAGYFLPIIYKAFFGKVSVTKIASEKYGEAPFPMLIAIGAAAIMVLVLFAWPDVFLGLAEMVGG